MAATTSVWQAYQEDVREIVRRQWQERQLLCLWLGMVEATHRDKHTMAFLAAKLRLGDWSGKLIATARHLAETADAERLVAA